MPVSIVESPAKRRRVTLHQALVWNVGTCRLDVKGEIQGADPQG